MSGLGIILRGLRKRARAGDAAEAGKLPTDPTKLHYLSQVEAALAMIAMVVISGKVYQARLTCLSLLS